MSKPPAFQFYANDWLSSSTIALMTAEQERGYLRLLLHSWASGECCLPNDDEVLAKLSLMNEGWLKDSSRLVRRCFIKHPNDPSKIINEKLFEVWKNQQNWRAKCAKGGKKSGEARRKRSQDKGLKKTRRVVQRPCEVKGQVKGNTSVFSLQSSLVSSNEDTHTVLAQLQSPWNSPECARVFDKWFTYLARKGKPAFDPQEAACAAVQFFSSVENLANNVAFAVANQYVTLKNYLAE